MFKCSFSSFFSLISLLLTLLPHGSYGQTVQSTQLSDPNTFILAEIERVEATMAAIDAAVDLSDDEKAELQTVYAESLQSLNNARAHMDSLMNYRALADSASTQTQTVQQQLQDLSLVEAIAETLTTRTVDELRQAVDVNQSIVAKLNDSNKSLAQELTALKARPVEIAARLPEARSELDRLSASLASDVDAVAAQDRAAHTLLQAERKELQAEIAMLEQELNSHADRSDLLIAKKQLVNRKVKNAQATLNTYQKALDRAQMSELDRLIADAQDYMQITDGGDSEVSTLAEEVYTLVLTLKDSTQHLRQASEAHRELSVLPSMLTKQFSQIQKEVELGESDGIWSQDLIEQRRKLPNLNQLTHSLDARKLEIQRIRLDEFNYEQRLQALDQESNHFATSPRVEVASLLKMREQLLRKLVKNYGLLIEVYSKMDTAERHYRLLVIKVRDYLWEKLFWKKSSPALWSIKMFDFNNAWDWLFRRGRITELVGAIQQTFHQYSYLFILWSAAWISLIAFRRRFNQVIEETATHIRHTSTDTFAHTVRAIVGTALLTLPFPMLLGSLSWVFERSPGSSDWLLGVARGLRWSFYISLWVNFLLVACRPGGLGIAHFGWHAAHTNRLRRLLYIFMLIGLPILVIICSLLYEQNSFRFDWIGRFFYLGLQFWLLIALWQIFNAKSGMFADAMKAHPQRWFTRTQPLWFPLLLSCPLLLMILAIVGYFVTAMVLSLQFVASLGIATLGSFCYFTTVRWFMIRERKLALVEALEARRIRLEQSASMKEDRTSSEKISLELKEPELDLHAIGQQTRRLMRSLFTIAVIFSLWFLWSAMIPADAVFEQIKIAGWLNLFDLFNASAILIITIIVVKNLPGLLELAGLRASTMEVGTRYAITSIVQYIVLAIGLAIIFSVLHVNWSMFGWIATALSVGLGFGLQEIVSNFVCGIILLFERPIRVGDVITINEVTGTVTQIRMRATTITNWDRQELVVPNKQFISDALINWTLSNTINRVIIEVGVAYGSDTVRAKELLVEIAQAHPNVLPDPAPLASFEEFADSSLNLKLRAYLPDMNNRVSTITALHDTISQRFQAEGIEIAFPQRDLHIRTMPGSGLGVPTTTVEH